MSLDDSENVETNQEGTSVSSPTLTVSPQPLVAPTLKNEEKKESDDSNKNPYTLKFYSLTNLPFKMTPERHKELNQFSRITNAPYQNVPLLKAEREEDILPLLSLFLKTPEGKGLSFFSVSSTDFGLAYMDPSNHSDIQKNMDLGATIVEEASLQGQIPVYSGVADYEESNMLGQFVRQYLKGNIPGVIVATEPEMEVLQPIIDKDAFLTGGLENPQKPFSPRGMSCVVPMEIAPLTLNEKKIYFRHHLKELMKQYNLTISDKECDFFVQRIDEAFEHKDVFFKVFDIANQAISRAFEKDEYDISRQTLLDVLPEKEPKHNPVQALAHMDEKLKKTIFGQDKAIQTAHEIILANLDDESRVKPTILGFFGPSGVGKTALAEEISKAMNNEPITTFNMSEYSDDFKVSQLTGSSKGYVDSDEDGLLAKAIQENPKAVILLDEFEKAHEKIQKMFLGIFDKGFVFDNHAGKVDMSKATFILTSNAGVRSNQQLGFGAPQTTTYEADEDLISKSFPSELLGRIDAKILFNPLSRETLEKVVDKFMKMCQPRFDKLGVEVVLSPKAREELITQGQDPQTGARPLLTLIRQKIKAPIEIAVYKKKIKVQPKAQRKQKTKVVVQSVQTPRMQVVPAKGLRQQAYSL